MVINLSENSDVATNRLGAKYEDPDTGKVYRYVKVHASGTAPVVGNWLFRYAAATEWVVSAACESIGGSVNTSGVCTTALTAGYYGWIQTGGPNAKMYTNNSGAGAACVGSVAIPCTTAGAAKWVHPTTCTEYTNSFMPVLARANASETSQATTAGLIYGYVAGVILMEGTG